MLFSRTSVYNTIFFFLSSRAMGATQRARAGGDGHVAPGDPHRWHCVPLQPEGHAHPAEGGPSLRNLRGIRRGGHSWIYHSGRNSRRRLTGVLRNSFCFIFSLLLIFLVDGGHTK